MRKLQMLIKRWADGVGGALPDTVSWSWMIINIRVHHSPRRLLIAPTSTQRGWCVRRITTTTTAVCTSYLAADMMSSTGERILKNWSADRPQFRRKNRWPCASAVFK